jgi:hypothetical protein
MNRLVIACCLFAFEIVFGTVDWSLEYQIVPNICVDLGSTDSVQYRCSDDSVWKYYYGDDSTCSGVATTVNRYAGCEDSLIYNVSGCAKAQEAVKSNPTGCGWWASSTTDSIYPLNVCYNTETSYNSYQYICDAGTTIYQYQYSDNNCADANPVLVAMTAVDFNCGSMDCHATVDLYTHSTSDVCNYDGSQYESGSKRECKYILLNDNEVEFPYAIDVCTSYREGYYEWSTKYRCNDTDGTVELWYWLDNTKCASDADNKYLVSTFSATDYTFNCTMKDTCDGKIRTYDDSNAEDCEHPNKYSEVSVAFDTCLPSNNENDEYDIYWYMYTCVDNYLALFYYFDNECTESPNTFYIYNTSDDACPTVVSGCTNKNDQFSQGYYIGVYNYIILLLSIITLLQLL